MKKFRSISTILALIMLWSISFHSLASSQGDENLPGPKNKDIFTSTASVVNTTADKSFDAESASATTIVQTDVDDTFVVNFQCKLAEALEEDLNYTLLITQTEGSILISYHDSLGNYAAPGFIFILEKDEPVKIILDESSEILKDGQSMSLDFWEELATGYYVSTVKADTFEADNNIIDLTFTLIATEGEQQIIEHIEPTPGNYTNNGDSATISRVDSLQIGKIHFPTISYNREKDELRKTISVLCLAPAVMLFMALYLVNALRRTPSTKK